MFILSGSGIRLYSLTLFNTTYIISLAYPKLCSSIYCIAIDSSVRNTRLLISFFFFTRNLLSVSGYLCILLSSPCNLKTIPDAMRDAILSDINTLISFNDKLLVKIVGCSNIYLLSIILYHASIT